MLHGLSHITVTRLHEIQNGHSPISGCISFCLPDELSAGKQFLSQDITAYQHTKALTRYPNIISAKKLFTLPPKFHTSVINFLKYWSSSSMVSQIRFQNFICEASKVYGLLLQTFCSICLKINITYIYFRECDCQTPRLFYWKLWWMNNNNNKMNDDEKYFTGCISNIEL